MLALLSLLCLAACEISQAQVVYSQVVPYDPRYLIRRPPVRRSAMDTLERMRLPVSRYFPQVDTQVAPALYQPALSPVGGTYQLTPDDIYALPPQWAEGLIQQLPDRGSEYEGYDSDYESGSDAEDDGFAPVYRTAHEELMFPQGLEKTWAEPQGQSPDGNMYNDLMVNYVYGEPVVRDFGQNDLFEMKRRDTKQTGTVLMSSVAEANQNSTGKAIVPVVSVATDALTSTQASVVAMTGVPPPPEKKEVKSLVLPEPDSEESWLRPDDVGQKEVPLFRPRQSSQQTRWPEIQERRPGRVKNTGFKSPIPMIKKMIQSGKPQSSEIDSLTEELANLRKLRKP